MLQQELLRLEERARAEGKLPQYQSDFAEASESLKDINVSGPADEATGKLIHWYQTLFMELQNKLHAKVSGGELDRICKR